MSKWYVNLFVFICILYSSFTVTAESHFQSKSEFIKKKVPKGHDFTTIAENAVYRQGHLLVRFAPRENGLQNSRSEKKQILSSLGGAIIKRDFRRVSGLTLVDLPPDQSVEDALKTYNARTDILYAEPDYEITIFSTFPNDTYFNSLWGMHNTGQSGGTPDADIDAPEAWDISTDANNIIVAVLDTGVDYTHPDLEANIWVNDSELNGDPNVDNDGNGYVDDIYGYDFADNDPDPNDYYFHGTHVAGIVGSDGNNNKGVVGTCWNVKIMDLKIFPNYGEEGFVSGAISAIEYSVDNGAKVLNNSWGGGPYNQSLRDEIEDAQDAGVLFVAAAGNDGVNNDIYPNYPSGYDLDNIISVMATDHNDMRPYWSNYGVNTVDLSAPGVDILSTFPTNETDAMAYYGLSTDYETISGTSMAVPHVAGACALLWAQHPDWSYLEVKEAILDSADKLSSLQGLCVSGGRLNLYNALTYKPPLMSIYVMDDVGVGDPNDPNYHEGVSPYDTITYTIGYAPSANNHYDVEVKDILPRQAWFESADPNYGVYDLLSHTYTWYEGTVYGHDPNDPSDPNTYLTITVRVNEMAEPLSEITNTATVESFGENESYHWNTQTTPICCWGGDTIYVNQSAQGYNTGTCWDDAYVSLQKALARASQDCGDEIWVAKGVYVPGGSFSDSFALVDGAEVYGGFAGNETSRNERSFVRNLTYLSGEDVCSKVITGDGVSSHAILDGFIVQAGNNNGVYCDGGNPNISNCVIMENGSDGLYCQNSNMNITDSVIINNGGAGIEGNGYGCSPTIQRCNIYDNAAHGINAQYCSPFVTNNWIHHNGAAGSGSGIYLNNPSSASTIRNNTIVYNKDEAISKTSFGTAPNISNCILWHNNPDDGYFQLEDCSADYSCITDPNDPNGIAPGADTPDQNGNITCNPRFAYRVPDLYNYHLDLDSDCIDMGDDTGVGLNETDIDGDDRIIDWFAETAHDVDMGADEVGCEEVSNELDWNANGLVDLFEYGTFATAWQSHDPNDPYITTDPNDIGEPNYVDPDAIARWDSRCNLDGDCDIDLVDLAYFCEGWLWQACWLNTEIWMLMSTDGGGLGRGMATETISTSDIEAAKLARWLRTRPAYEPTDYEKLLQLRDLLAWMDLIWQQDEDLRKQFTEDQWFDWMKSIYDQIWELEHLIHYQD